MSGVTQAERLATIEALLNVMAADVKAIRQELDADKAELAALKNKGTGMLIGVALAAAFLGAKATAILQAVLGAFK